MRSAFDLPVGYSDHSAGIEIAIAAVAIGASVIEKHFTLDRSMPGPDHQASLEPDELKTMVRAIRHVEVALGDGRKAPALCEQKNIPIARKGLIAAKSLSAGEVVGREAIAIKRPSGGIEPRDISKVAGLRVTRPVLEDTPLTWDMFK